MAENYWTMQNIAQAFIWRFVCADLHRFQFVHPKIPFQSNLHSASCMPSCVNKVPYVSPAWFMFFKLNKAIIQFNYIILFNSFTWVSVISYLQGIPHIFFLVSSLRFGRATQGLLKPCQFLVGCKCLLVVLLEHYCPNLRSLALWIKFSFGICLYLVPCFLPQFPKSLPAAATCRSQYNAVHTATSRRDGGRGVELCALQLLLCIKADDFVVVLSVHLLILACN